MTVSSPVLLETEKADSVSAQINLDPHGPLTELTRWHWTQPRIIIIARSSGVQEHLTQSEIGLRSFDRQIHLCRRRRIIPKKHVIDEHLWIPGSEAVYRWIGGVQTYPLPSEPRE